MLKQLTVQDLALVQALDIDLNPGLTVITGESGAGKSILLAALGLVLGDRASSDLLRPGTERTDVVAEFDVTGLPHIVSELSALELTDPDEPQRCLVRRTISMDGRSRAFVNGVPVTIAQLRTLTEALVDIHGQHENQRINERAAQLAMLDDYIGKTGEREQLIRAWRDWQRSEKRIADLEREATAREDRAALLSYQLQELDELHLAPGEFDELSSRHRRLGQVNDIRETVSQAMETLEALDGVRHLARLLDDLDDNHPHLQAARDALGNALELTGDVEKSLRRYEETLEADPETLAELDERISAIMQLARKHRLPPAELAAHREQLETELGSLSADRSELESLRKTAADTARAWRRQAETLRKARQSGAKGFADAITATLKLLGLKKACFEVRFSEAENETGLDAAEYWVTTNPKYPAAPMQRIASGGEQARIYLAIQVVAAAKTRLPTLVLDEADVGVGGTTADILGRMLRELGTHTQVLCVTHAPQVAALGDHHLRVVKTDAEDTELEVLDATARVEELARMLAGSDVTQKTRDYAHALLAGAA